MIYPVRVTIQQVRREPWGDILCQGGRVHWWLLLGALGSFLGACFEPRYPEGIPCSEARTCPPSQICDVDGICRVSPSPLPVRDASVPQVPDARAPLMSDAQAPVAPDASAPDASERCVGDEQCPDGMSCSPEGACIAPACDDRRRNGTESDIDCGGICPACTTGGRCNTHDDCQSGSCADFTCVAASCTDGIKNAEETDIDCGGPACGKCEDARLCNQASDCAAGACVDGRCASQASCDVLRRVSPDAPSGTYTIDPEGTGQPFPVYCDMVGGDEGWTLVLKIDGTQDTFRYDAALWTNTTALGNATDLTASEAKSPAFWTVPMTQVRVVMREAGDDRNMTVSFNPALSNPTTLRALFLGPYYPTNNPRSAWLGLVSSGSLQTNCQQQGLNNTVAGQAMRIGIFGNQEANCLSCDSSLGIGHTSFASGNMAAAAYDDSGAGGRATRTFSFVFVR